MRLKRRLGRIIAEIAKNNEILEKPEETSKTDLYNLLQSHDKQKLVDMEEPGAFEAFFNKYQDHLVKGTIRSVEESLVNLMIWKLELEEAISQ